MRIIDTNTFVNSFKIKPDKSMSFLLGAGASVSSNIPSVDKWYGILKEHCIVQPITSGQVCIVICNFDDLVQADVHAINSGFSIKTISSAVSNSVGFSLNEGFPNIIKLHGDYLFDKLKNTESELQKLEDEIADIWKTSIKENGLVVIGYAGNDNSVMSVLEE